MLPAGFVLAVTIALVGRLADRQPTHFLVSIGLGLLALSFGLMVFVSLGSSLWMLVAFAILGRIGLGFILPSLNLGSHASAGQIADFSRVERHRFLAHARWCGWGQPVRHRFGMAPDRPWRFPRHRG